MQLLCLQSLEHSKPWFRFLNHKRGRYDDTNRTPNCQSVTYQFPSTTSYVILLFFSWALSIQHDPMQETRCLVALFIGRTNHRADGVLFAHCCNMQHVHRRSTRIRPRESDNIIMNKAKAFLNAFAALPAWFRCMHVSWAYSLVRDDWKSTSRVLIAKARTAGSIV